MNRTFIDFLDGLQGAKDKEAAWQHFQSFCERHGTRYVTHLEIPSSHVDADHAVYRVNMDKAWIDHYMEQNYVAHDPAVYKALASPFPFLFQRSVAMDQELWDEPELTIANEATEFGLGDGIIIPYFGYRGGIQGNITLFAQHCDADGWQEMEQHAERLMLGAVMMHTWFTHQSRRTPSSIKITPRQLETIRWMAAGLHNDQIADKMNISYDGVSYHMREIKRRLDVRTHREVVPKAFQLGLLEL